MFQYLSGCVLEPTCSENIHTSMKVLIFDLKLHFLCIKSLNLTKVLFHKIKIDLFVENLESMFRHVEMKLQGVSMPSFMPIGPKLWAIEGYIHTDGQKDKTVLLFYR